MATPFGFSTADAFSATLASARAGSRPAIHRIARHLLEPVRRKVHYMLGQELRRSRPWLAPVLSTNDIVQDTLLRVLTDLCGFRGTTEASLMSYLHVLVSHRIIDLMRFHEADRRDRRSQRSLADVGAIRDPKSDPVAESERAEVVGRLYGLLGQLDPRTQVLVHERLEHRTEFAELAATLGYPSEDAARKAFARAQAGLLLRLRGRGLDI
ncbi:MAG: RNA polymerase sigma factor [Myxococcota bacterium]